MPDERREEPEGLAERGERLLDADSDRTGDVEEGDDEGVFSAVLSRRRDWRGWSVLSPSEVMVRLRVDVMLVPNRIYRMSCCFQCSMKSVILVPRNGWSFNMISSGFSPAVHVLWPVYGMRRAAGRF